ncbi:ribonuclease H-like domain-containing protein [Tanacetum coccineum]
MRCMWLFHHKYLADGTLSRYKERLVANGSTRLEGVDVDETFSLVVKLGTIQTVLSLAASRHWPIHQLEVKNAFLYGPRAWFQRQETDTAYLLLYVDDIVLIASSESLLRQIIKSLRQEAHMDNCNPSRTPIDTESKPGSDGDLVCLYMHDPREPYFLALKRIMLYVRGNLDYGLQLFSSSTIDLVAYSDANWAGFPTTRRSTSGYCVFLGNNLLSWSSKHQPTLSCSSAEAKYRGVTNAVAETCWLRNLLRELHTPLSSVTLVYCDNVSSVYLSCNLVQHKCTKHIEINIHFIRDLVASSQIYVLHVPSHY